MIVRVHTNKVSSAIQYSPYVLNIRGIKDSSTAYIIYGNVSVRYVDVT